MDEINIARTVTGSLSVALILFLVGYLVNYLRKCRNISNLTDKLRNSYKREGSDFCVDQWHGFYGASKIFYWRRCSCRSGCSKCCSNEYRDNLVQKYTHNSSIPGPSPRQLDEDVNNDGDNADDTLLKPPGPEHVSIQCGKKPNTLLRYDELQKMFEKYEHYDLNRGNLSQGCLENKCGHDPVIFLLEKGY